MTRQEAEEVLTTAGTAPEADFPLFDVALACAVHEDPERDADAARLVLDEACARLKARLKTHTPDEAVCEALGGDCGFAGDILTRHDLRNADLIAVCDRRRGLAVTLAVVFLEAARRCRLEMRGVDFPGRFLLRLETDDGPMALDPFEGGRVVMPSDLVTRALQAGLPPTAASDLEHLMITVSSRRVALRLQDNLFAWAERAGDWERAERAAHRRALIDPADHRAWIDVAAAREGQGKLAGALDALARARRLDGGAAFAARAARERMRMALN